MKILITENQLKSLIKNIINEQDNNRTLELLKKKALMMDWFYENIVNKVKQITYPKYPKYPDKIFYVDKNTNEIYMEYNKKSRILWVSYDKIWSIFQSNYSRNSMEIKELIRNMIGEAYDLWNIKPITNWMGY